MLSRRTETGKDYFGIERYVLIGLSAALMAMPTMFFRWLAGRKGYTARKKAIEVWAFFKPVFFFGILISGYWSRNWTVLIAIITLTDLFLYLFGLVLLRDFWVRPSSYSRSLLLLGVNLFEFTAGFSIFYLHFGLLKYDSKTIADWGSAFYFSMVTAATVGYGDITPSPGLGRTLVTIQVFLSLVFMAVIISRFVGNLDQHRTPIEHA